MKMWAQNRCLLKAVVIMGGIFLFAGCTAINTETTPQQYLPQTIQKETIVVYSLENYTDTPMAGSRASNIVEGLLLARGYKVANRIDSDKEELSLEQKIKKAKADGYHYVMTGGVSEWRYKTGIDGEPAVSLHLKLIDVRTGRVMWTATGSDSSWGNASVGTVAQELISSLLG